MTLSPENENDAIEEAGRWYISVLAAVEGALQATAKTHDAAVFVRALARQGYSIEKESGSEEA